MEKEEFFESIKNKVNLTKKEFETEYQKVVSELEERGIEKKDIDKFALVMIRTKLKKQLMSPSKKFSGYIIGINANSALNRIVDKVKDDSIIRWRVNDTQAVEMKFTDSNGTPLWHSVEGVNIASWKMGTAITDDDYSETVVLLAKKEDDAAPKLAYLTLKGAKRDLPKPHYVEVEFLANVKSEEGGIYLLNQSIGTEFKVVNPNEINFPELSKKYLRNNCVTPDKLEMWFDKYGSDINRLAVVRGAVVNIVLSMDETKSHIVNLDYGGETLDNKTITCWISNKQEINFSESTPEIYVIGSPNFRLNEQTHENRASINVFGVYVPKEWRIEKPQPIEKSTEIEESEKNDKMELEKDW